MRAISDSELKLPFEMKEAVTPASIEKFIGGTWSGFAKGLRCEWVDGGTGRMSRMVEHHEVRPGGVINAGKF